MWFWFFIISATLNLLAIFYIRWLIKAISAINQDVEVITDMIAEFSIHIKSVYELEMFYGDDTLKSLMEHATKLSDQLSDLDLILNEQLEEEQLGKEED